MSEVRRATLMPFGGGDAADGAKKRRTEPHSVRLTFVLPESTESTCPVYNYKEELTAAKKRDKSKLQNGKTPPANGLDPFDEEDDDVKRIAMEMEAKYGTGPPSKKKRKNRRDDYADIGMGYDESDSFIDNTDGYDEMIPQNVTTLHGGFYINCGALEFKADEGVSSDLSSNSSDSSSSSEDEDDDAEAKKDANANKSANRKRILETSESEGENEADKTDKAEKKQKTGMVTNGLAPKKKKEGHPDDSKKMLENHKDKPPPKKSLQPAVGAAGVDDSKKKLVKDLTKDKRDEPMPLVSVNPVQPLIVSVVGGEQVKDSKFKNVIELAASSERKQSDKRDSIVPIAVAPVAERQSDNSRDKLGKDLQLPANLPPNISDLIKRIKDNVQRNKDSNRDVFSGPVNSLLISFERKSKVLGKQSRSRIYQNIATVLKVEKENLCKRAKNLVTSEDTRRLATLLSELKAKVAVLMVPLREVHERESQKVMNMKASDPEESKNVRMPKRKFQWTDDTRKMLREIVIIKKRLLIYEGKSKESIEIHLNLFIKSDVQVLWPEGWMTMAALFKLCSSFEKKQPGLNNSQQEVSFNASMESVSMPPPPVKGVSTSGSGSGSNAQNQKLKEKKPQLIEAKPKEAIPTAKILSTKEMQKFQANSVSITPILSDLPPSQTQSLKAKVLKASNDLVQTKIDGLPPFESPRGLSISQIPPAAHKSTIQARNILKPEKQVTPPPAGDRQTKFVNLAQNESAPENLTKRMSTDYNIDSIMSRKSDSASTSSAKRQSTEIIIPKEEPEDGSVSSVVSVGTKVPIENFMPRPMVMDAVKQEEDDVIVLDDSDDAPANTSRTSSLANELRRKPGPKSKTKFVDPALIKTAKSASSGGSIASTTVTSSSDKKSFKPEAPKEKKDSKNDGDDILKLMENLKELNKMTTPSKSADTSPASAVSVIAFNKTFAKSPTPTATATTASTASKPHDKPKTGEYTAGLTFNDVYQRHYLNSLSTTSSASAPAPPTPKTYNSAHTSSASAAQEKHYNSNNNYTTAPGQQAAKYKNNYQQHTGTYNLMDDMLANFITEYPYPKTANHKQKPTQK